MQDHLPGRCEAESHSAVIPVPAFAGINSRGLQYSSSKGNLDPRLHGDDNSNIAGFTLIEMLVAVVVAGIIFSFIFGTLTSTLAASKEAQKRLAVDHVGRFFIQKITTELSCATLLPFSGKGGMLGRHFTVAGKARDEIHFTSFNQTYLSPRPKPGAAEISYYFAAGETGAPTLMRRESDIIEAPVDLGGGSFEVSPDVEELSIKYKRGDKWEEAWDTEQNPMLPEAVSIELRLNEEGKSYLYTAVARPQT